MTINEKVRLEVLIVQKDEALAAAEARVAIYRTVIDDFSQQAKSLREENERLNRQIEMLNIHKKRYQEEILDLEKHNEELFAALNNVRNIITRAADGIEELIRVD